MLEAPACSGAQATGRRGRRQHCLRSIHALDCRPIQFKFCYHAVSTGEIKWRCSQTFKLTAGQGRDRGTCRILVHDASTVPRERGHDEFRAEPELGIYVSTHAMLCASAGRHHRVSVVRQCGQPTTRLHLRRWSFYTSAHCHGEPERAKNRGILGRSLAAAESA